MCDIQCSLQALGDLALRRGIKQLDSFLKSSITEPANPVLDPELVQLPLLDLLLGVLQRWEKGLEGMAAKAKRAKGAGMGKVMEQGCWLCCADLYWRPGCFRDRAWSLSADAARKIQLSVGHDIPKPSKAGVLVIF